MEKHTPTILVIEDEKALLKAWAEIFTREGFNVLTTSDPTKAINLAFRWKPDLLLVDLILSEAENLNLTKQFRENKWGQNTPIMFLSGLASHESEPNKKHVQDSYLEDNWNFDQVVREVKIKLKPTKINMAPV